MIGMAMMMPDLNFQQNGGTPGGSTPAGTVGGGGLPSDGSISTAALSLALVPAGLAAVAIFPPFVRLVYRCKRPILIVWLIKRTFLNVIVVNNCKKLKNSETYSFKGHL